MESGLPQRSILGLWQIARDVNNNPLRGGAGSEGEYRNACTVGCPGGAQRWGQIRTKGEAHRAGKTAKFVHCECLRAGDAGVAGAVQKRLATCPELLRPKYPVSLEFRTCASGRAPRL
jgi:hypothetical protein